MASGRTSVSNTARMESGMVWLGAGGAANALPVLAIRQKKARGARMKTDPD
ncbi:hypothetical protein AA21291_1137 [Swaminathania salitolerans LMG 21291]|uniref:Uncharacterized protein n=1 Tax=Swaminathania salitolerans TaxID=182838 RepID=A0A511BR32_9PROT|nr:hypothetical protein AA21291_1137 [Swaminathania salitolerans LMG 21291]GEL02796.1 hypothetical protein SSA02_19590 [Swaminathania salitolerans]